MIRDPSDGSVKEITPDANKINAVTPKSPAKEIMPGFVPGIRQPTRTDAQERMDRSREWLKIYQEKQNARGNDEQELPPAGHPIKDQRTT